MIRMKVVAACAFAMLLASCCAQPINQSSSLSPDSEWRDSRIELLALPGWSLRARVGGTGSGGFNGRLRWEQQGEAFSVSLAGPLNIGRVDLVGTPDRVEVTTKEHNFITESPEQALQELAGWSVPLESLSKWVFAIPGDSAQQLQLDDADRPISFVEDGWLVTFADWQEHDGYLLPRKLRMQRDDLKLRYVLDAWVSVNG